MTAPKRMIDARLNLLPNNEGHEDDGYAENIPYECS